MNIEIEIKVKIDDIEGVRKKVNNLGKLIKSIDQIDDYYIPCHRDFFAEKPHPVEWLRIRSNPDKTIFEYDRSINKNENGIQEYAEEYESEISNPNEFKQILKFLNFRHVITVNKQREYWMCGNVEVALDQIKGLGNFIEVEAKGDFNTATEARNTCVRFLENLGIKDVDNIQINNGYPQLILKNLGK
ncbi:MAG: hypothetical protein A3G52_02020 [Candidatus Taylorbacteria bacterium RIFCSPLOWO2_12_FULL_43_20]|uniref:CYTH domain-containing protein n=1 Tax=Candidatus Taylorbacteria bacterium RIFCSPLOWO2_12_FULL_43_20 TaxID=1802332 RepID=A0A1G2P3T2_9BACT|nr:MAG: hypothetical protein A3B98_01990 [Candidatus Taylorbacteria bacterium RIFCSPHIGHO2_02_FULL_43_55]OHA30144.1 MAG: hypothetical protein A3E92_01025 [Candidatus Taylorbacteria bacterium RIFCSPHIGHO2_12_FULL_42_34]OHA31796.1 MAG: hypothetical protein A3B09_02530 [Candidatus Taylorbacteria bacterium RIFCSPLOWO2_01_FULL_43_83]OHA39615.1 MAG: hypothetical protein A3H58_02465 [Candidatus Taylorbacteria bacterium RIFCSPLOWO2_02_FULL_43_22b]OHA42996.1 MAG: hypothetical protein A3G52_02020 [Candid